MLISSLQGDADRRSPKLLAEYTAHLGRMQYASIPAGVAAISR
jgi:hypothetical protein